MEPRDPESLCGIFVEPGTFWEWKLHVKPWESLRVEPFVWNLGEPGWLNQAFQAVGEK